MSNNKQEFIVDELPTQCVTLFPTKAHVVRLIRDVTLEPGLNEIEIYGLTPSTDEHSVKVDVDGSAIVSDMTVELTMNRGSFHEAYPDSDGESNESDEDSGNEPSTVQQDLRSRIRKLEQEIKAADEAQASCQKRLAILNRYGESLDSDKKSTDELASLLILYSIERSKLYEESVEVTRRSEELTMKLARTNKILEADTKEQRRQDVRLRKERVKMAEKKRRHEQMKKLEKDALKAERSKFWPKKLYRIVVTIESTYNTPASSRRASVTSITMAQDTEEQSMSDRKPISLILSYVTQEASWTPRYDISINTQQSNGTIIYQGQYTNNTSETWKDTKVVLSTSQTVFQGVGDAAPILQPWHVSLSKLKDDGLLSVRERNHHLRARNGFGTTSRLDRSYLFGATSFGENTAVGSKWHLQSKNELLETQDFARGEMKGQEQRQQQQNSDNNLFGGNSNFQNQFSQPQTATAAFGSNNDNNNVVGSCFGYAAATNRSGSQGGLFGTLSIPKGEKIDPKEEAESSTGPTVDLRDHIQNHLQPENQIYNDEPNWEDSGLTSTYEIPGIRTIVPSSLARRHKIASIAITNVQLSWLSIPKLRPAAFLKAVFRNSSTVTILRGAAGLTLDGSFMGNISLPRKSPGESITIPLGVDPAVNVSYAKPTVVRSTQGLINRASAQTFIRSITVMNTKIMPINITIVDQIPVSDDEKLKIDILKPSGLVKKEDRIPTGTNARQGSKDKWGQATATLKADGKILWNTILLKGSACTLALEYEIKAPTSETVTSVT